MLAVTTLSCYKKLLYLAFGYAEIFGFFLILYLSVSQSERPIMNQAWSSIHGGGNHLF